MRISGRIRERYMCTWKGFYIMRISECMPWWFRYGVPMRDLNSS